MSVQRGDLAQPILDILEGAASGKGLSPHYLTGYQILMRLPNELREALIREHGEPGRGAGKNSTAVSRIAKVAREIADYDFMDSRGLSIEHYEGEDINPGNRVTALYRARR
jgi:hypothetical protein